MARQGTVHVNGTTYTLQTISFRDYSRITDRYLTPIKAEKDTAEFIDQLIKMCVIAPKDVAVKGLDYFEEQGDLVSPQELAEEIQNFLVERQRPKDAAAEG